MNKKHFVLGGDIQKSLNQGYKFNFKVLFKDAFQITRKNYLPLIVACLFAITILLAIFGLSHEKFLNEHMQIAVNLIFSSFIITPLVAALSMMGINHSVGLKTKSIDVFGQFNIVLKLALANMIISLSVYGISTLLESTLGGLGSSLALVVALYMNVVFCLTYPLIAEKKVAPQLALKLSFLIVNKNLIQFTILFMLITLVAVVAIIPSGLGLFLFFPFYFNLMGIVYREICGVGLIAIETEPTVEGDLPESDTPHDQTPAENEEQVKPVNKTDEKPTSPASDKFEA